MKKSNKLKYIIIAVGIILSTAFYVLGGSFAAAFGDKGESMLIGEEAADGQAADGRGETAGDGGHSGLFGLITGSVSGGEGSADDSGEPAAASAADAAGSQSEDAFGMLSEAYAARLDNELYVGSDGRGYLSDEFKNELRAYIRTAIREELTAICEEGYLERALSEAAGAAAAEAERKAGLVNINTADTAELMTLDGIGEKRAADIVAYRESNGPFGTPEDIMQVSGIKQSAYDKIKDKIYTE